MISVTIRGGEMYSSSIPLRSGLLIAWSSPDSSVRLGLRPNLKTQSIRLLSKRQRCPRASLSSDPLLVQAARGNAISRPPAWMMRQAGRYMAVYRKLAEKYPSFRVRSETVDLIVEISLQPWRAFRPDGVGKKAAVLGFVGAPWTIATYIVEGGTTRTYTTIKRMCHTAPHVLRVLLSHLTQAISDYIIFQVKSGAQCIQIFDSWGGQLPPHVWEHWSKPYIKQIVSSVRKECPQTPLVLYINGNGGLIERMTGTGVDVVGLDWTVDMADGRRRLGNNVNVQGNVDPAYLFSPLPVLTDEIHRVVRCAGRRGHILNLGHGVLVNTPEEAVAHFFDVVRGLSYDSLFEDDVAVDELEPLTRL
nr:PREDICTED: uroporphyrinogen decarboxylase 1, chloroplastic-like isoform X2 [Musa acuminata subsp. malaccensis]